MTTVVPDVEIAGGSPLDPRLLVPRRSFFKRLLRRPAAVVSLAYLVLISLACIFAPVLAPYSADDQDLNHVLDTPTGKHWLGTDDLGRDILSRLLWGGRPSLLGVVQAVVVIAVVGVVFGLLAGYFGGWVDWLISRAVDIVMAIPSIIVVLSALAVFGQNMLAAMVTFGLLGGVGLVRVVRATTLAVRNELYVAAARVSGVSRTSIIARHILPRLAGPVIVQISLFAGVALGVQTGLAFLGLGITPPAPSWGGMVGDAAQLVQQDGWLLVPSGGIIALTILAFGILGDAARDATVEGWSVDQRRRRKRRRPTASAAAAAVPAAPDVSSPQLVPSGATSVRTVGLRDEQPILAVRDLTIGFGTEREHSTVVNAISFDLYPGEIVGLVGESGSGKTVTALSLLGLLPANGTAFAGTATMDGEDLLAMSQKELRQARGRKLGLISQEPMSSLDPAFTVGNQLREIVRAHNKCGRREANQRVVELLRTVRLRDPEAVAKKYPHELSGGMAQRVVIALALSSNPKVLIADEPTTALDVTVQSEILELLRSLQAEQQMTVLFVTHNLAVVADLCDRAIVMTNGRIVEAAPVQQLFDSPQDKYTRSLLAATPSLIDLPNQQAAGTSPVADPAVPSPVPPDGTPPDVDELPPASRAAGLAQ